MNKKELGNLSDLAEAIEELSKSIGVKGVRKNLKEWEKILKCLDKFTTKKD